MIAYGKEKRGSSKIHPHNECSVCSESSISKNRERQKAKEQIEEEIVENEIKITQGSKQCFSQYSDLGLKVFDVKFPSFNMTFYSSTGEMLGSFYEESGILKFNDNADESAKAFVKLVSKQLNKGIGNESFM